MKQNFSFSVLILALVGVLGWWGKTIEGSAALVSFSGSAVSTPSFAESNQSSAGYSSSRREILEALDRLVSYELYYRSVYGRFTKILSRLGYEPPREVARNYEIQVAEASVDRLSVTAFSEQNGRLIDRISINQDFEVNANFKLPPPRAEYLRAQAMRHLRILRSSESGQKVAEKGIFKDYFSYEVRSDSEERKVAFAVGVRPPVVGMHLEYGPSQSNEEAQAGLSDGLDSPVALDLEEFSPSSEKLLGARAMGNVMTHGEEAHLAQTIFEGEMGRHAKILSELSKIADFEFRKTERDVSVVDEKNQELERRPAQAADATVGPLEIEPVLPEHER